MNNQLMTLDTRLMVGDLFDSLGGEVERESRRYIEVKGNPGLEAIVKGFEEILINQKGNLNLLNDFYEICLGLAPDKIDSSDITQFSIYLKKYEDKGFFDMKIPFYLQHISNKKKIGIYLSALINKSEDNKFKLSLQHLNSQLDYIGYMNTKDIQINGNVGDGIGHSMVNGKIVVNGNVGNSVGYEMLEGEINIFGNAEFYVGNNMNSGSIQISGNSNGFEGKYMDNGIINILGNSGDYTGGNMNGGKLFVFGNAGYNLGRDMLGGEIHICGNAEECVGDYMFGGLIYIEGDYKNLSKNIKRGCVYHKDKLIVRNGRRTPGKYFNDLWRKIRWQ